MRNALLVTLAAVLSLLGQTSPPPERAPVYRITVVSQTTKAVNYGHLSGPTPIGFHGTVLMPDARGEAQVESRAGAVDIDARFDHVEAPTRFGPQYLTYVVWAISPEGKASNLGELVLNAADKGKVHVTSNLQSFALIVTAEPYFSVSQPGGVVVMENRILPETIGQTEEVVAHYDLLPVKPYTYNLGSANPTAGNAHRVSQDQYEAVLALYQALNALQIAGRCRRGQGGTGHTPQG